MKLYRQIELKLPIGHLSYYHMKRVSHLLLAQRYAFLKRRWKQFHGVMIEELEWISISKTIWKEDSIDYFPKLKSQSDEPFFFIILIANDYIYINLKS